MSDKKLENDFKEMSSSFHESMKQNYDLLIEITRLKADLAELRERCDEADRKLMGYHEYFKAIERGEYPNSRPEMRTFELILLHRSEDYFAKYKGDKK